MHKIIHGDCYREIEKLKDHSIDLVLTDPPYIIGAKGCGIAASSAYLKKITASSLDKGFDIALLNQFLRVLKTPNIIIFCSRLQLREYMNWAHANGLKWALILLHKTNPTPLTNNNYLPDTEYAFHFWRGKKLGGRYHTKRRFYVITTGRNAFKHPTVKPLQVISNLIENATKKGDIILDPFLGSGTTAVAAKLLGRSCIGIEKQREYVALARQRFAKGE